jgi:DNA replication and repair protein RecF
VQITKIRLQNFRCFKDFQLSFDKKVVLIQGDNGSGKTSLLEAIFYLCYLRSFRTRLSRELLSFSKEHFFLQVDFDQEVLNENQIQVGYSNAQGKLIKFNQKEVKSYKEILSAYKIISVTEDDLNLVSGQPENRRAFINQSIFLIDPNFVTTYKNYRQVLEQRNAFLSKKAGALSLSGSEMEELFTWTRQLWEQTIVAQKLYISFLEKIGERVCVLLDEYFNKKEDSIFVKLEFQAKNTNVAQSFEAFWISYKEDLILQELRWGRSVFGIHLDDFSISFQKKKAKYYASRGEQKLVLLLLKIAQFLEIEGGCNSGCILLDDFLTDFDAQRISSFVKLLSELNCQIFLTTPLKASVTSKMLNFFDLQIIQLHRPA